MTTDYEEVRNLIRSVRDGLISEQESAYLFNLANTTPLNSVIVEVGSHTGKSSASIGFACLGTCRKLFCIDCWQNEAFYERWKTNIKSFGLEGYVFPIRGWSGRVLKDWGKVSVGLGITGDIDMIFIDGNHSMTDVTKDFSSSYYWVKDNGIFAFHDCGHPDYPDVAVFWEVARSVMSDNMKVDTIVSGRKTPLL